jgi:hypothetical protein
MMFARAPLPVARADESADAYDENVSAAPW